MALKKIDEYIDKQMLLSMGEDMVKNVYINVLKPMMKEMIKDSDNKYDDLILPFIDDIDKVMLPLIDKIDGEEG